MAEDGEFESAGGDVLFLHPIVSNTTTHVADQVRTEHAPRRGLARDAKPSFDAEILQRDACRIIARLTSRINGRVKHKPQTLPRSGLLPLTPEKKSPARSRLHAEFV